MRDRILGLKKISITQLRGFSGGNPKQRNANDRALLAASLQNHGYVLPMAVRKVDDGTYELIDGHGRLDEIAEMEPGAEVKVLVLDVASVAEGRRILLALQHTAGWDVDKLEEFVRAGLAEGTTIDELMADTGLTDRHLEAFATSAANMLEGAAASSSAGNDASSSDDEADKTNEGVSRAGLNPEHVQFAVPVTRPQNKTISAALKLAKQLTGVEVKGDALEAVCAFYIEQKREAKKPKKSKRDA